MRNVTIPQIVSLLLIFAALGFFSPVSGQAPADGGSEAEAAPDNEALLMSKTRQLTFEGRRAGEGYFSADGTRMVFQSERAPEPVLPDLCDRSGNSIERVSRAWQNNLCVDPPIR